MRILSTVKLNSALETYHKQMTGSKPHLASTTVQGGIACLIAAQIPISCPIIFGLAGVDPTQGQAICDLLVQSVGTSGSILVLIGRQKAKKQLG